MKTNRDLRTPALNKRVPSVLGYTLLVMTLCVSSAASTNLFAQDNNSRISNNSLTTEKSSAIKDFTLKSFQGENIRLAELRGHFVLLHFWASWSGTSVRNLSELELLYQKYKSNGLKVLSINFDPENSEYILDELNIDHWLLLDDAKKVARLFEIDTIPAYVLLDKSGHILFDLKGVDSRHLAIIEKKLIDLSSEEL